MLFEPYKIKNLQSKNRVVMAPMCQYMADDGMANNYHLVHYTARAIGQVGIIILEASAVEARGRISMNDLGLWDDKFIEPLSNIIKECKRYGSLVGIQIAHAGRKSRIQNEEIVAPSPIAFNDDFPTPKELTVSEISNIVDKFGQAAKRAEQAKFDFIEIHGAHGYLISEFLSPITNKRSDEYGKNRVLFLKQVLEKTRENFPIEKPVFLRISGEEYHPEGNTQESLADLLLDVSDLYDILHISSGGLYDKESYKVYPGYQLKYAKKLKYLIKKPTIAVGRLENPEFANEILINKQADLIAIARGLLSDPHWPLHAAEQLGINIEWPGVYERAKGI
ncbi:MAG: NADH:flavin oxidoreductase/NADH oxidase [Bacteroidota bacterium]